MKYLIRQLEPCWVECFYAVEAETEDDAFDQEENWEFIGHTCTDHVDFLSIEQQGAEPMPESMPWMAHTE